MAYGDGIDNNTHNMMGQDFKEVSDSDGNHKYVLNKEPIDDMSLLATISQATNDANDWNTSNLSSQRVDAYNLYYGAYPSQRAKGRSRYVSLDVLDSVETLQASLLNVFASSRQVINFEPFHRADTMECEQSNMAMDYILNNQNNQYDIHSSVIFDGLLTKMGVVKVYHDQLVEIVEFPFEGTQDELDMLLAQSEDLTSKDEEEDVIEADGINEYGEPVVVEIPTLRAQICQEVVRDKICIDSVPPEEFLIDDKATCAEDAVFTCHQRDVTIGDLREMGFDPEKIDEVGKGDSDGNMSVDYERVARNQYDNKGSFSTNVPIADESMSYVTLYESYLIADYEGTGFPYMCQIFSVKNVLLEKTKVSQNPFHSFVPYPISHKLFGQSVADRVGGIQIYNSTLKRAILDNAEINNNTRYVANVGQLINPRELTDTRFGGVVRVKGSVSGVVEELAKPQLSAATFPTIQMLEEEKAQRIGVNKMSQGLSEDALKPGNAASKVSELLSISFQRQKTISRQYANFWKKVYEHTYELAVAYMPYLDVPNPEGEPIILRPDSWRSTRTAVVSDSLAFGEAEQKAQQLVMIDQTLANDPSAANIYTEQDKTRLWNEVFDNLGYPEAFITPTDPNNPSPVQQQQMMLQQQQLAAQQQANMLAQQQLQLQMMDRELAARKIDGDLANKQGQLKLDLKEFELDARSTADDQTLEDKQFELDARYKADLIELQQEQLELDRRKAAMEAMLEVKQERPVALDR